MGYRAGVDVLENRKSLLPSLNLTTSPRSSTVFRSLCESFQNSYETEEL